MKFVIDTLTILNLNVFQLGQLDTISKNICKVLTDNVEDGIKIFDPQDHNTADRLV